MLNCSKYEYLNLQIYISPFLNLNFILNFVCVCVRVRPCACRRSSGSRTSSCRDIWPDLPRSTRTSQDNRPIRTLSLSRQSTSLQVGGQDCMCLRLTMRATAGQTSVIHYSSTLCSSDCMLNIQIRKSNDTDDKLTLRVDKIFSIPQFSGLILQFVFISANCFRLLRSKQANFLSQSFQLHTAEPVPSVFFKKTITVGCIWDRTLRRMFNHWASSVTAQIRVSSEVHRQKQNKCILQSLTEIIQSTY